MGSFDAYDEGTGKTAQEAYEALVAQARAEFGYDSYNGTISNSNGFRMVTNTPQRREAAYRMAHERILELNKWDNWECIPLADDNDFTVKIVKVKIDPPKENGYIEVNDRLWEIKRALRLEPNQTLGDIQIETTGAWSKVKLPAGKYKVGWLTFDTKAEALAYAKEQADKAAKNDRYGSEKFVVTQECGGWELVRKNPRTTATVQVITPKKNPKPTNRWLFYGMAAS